MTCPQCAITSATKKITQACSASEGLPTTLHGKAPPKVRLSPSPALQACLTIFRAVVISSKTTCLSPTSGRLRLLTELPALLRHRRALRRLGPAADVAAWQVERHFWGAGGEKPEEAFAAARPGC